MKVTVTPAAVGTFANPSNICVDPGLNVPESNENNNGCSDTVTVTAPDLTSVKDEQHRAARSILG